MFKKILNKATKEVEQLGIEHEPPKGGKHGEGARASHAAHGGGKAPASAAGKAAGDVPNVSKTKFDIAGLPINVFGLKELTPPSSGGMPDVCLVFHMHGRTGSADREEPLVREIYGDIMQAKTQMQG